MARQIQIILIEIAFSVNLAMQFLKMDNYVAVNDFFMLAI